MGLHTPSSCDFDLTPYHDNRDAVEDENLVGNGDACHRQQSLHMRSFTHSLVFSSFTDVLLDGIVIASSIYFLAFAFIVWRRDLAPMNENINNSLLEAAKFVSRFFL